LKNRRLKANSKFWKIGKILEKWVFENCNLVYFALQRWRYSTRIVTNRIKSSYASAKRSRYSTTVMHVQKLEKNFLK